MVEVFPESLNLVVRVHVPWLTPPAGPCRATVRSEPVARRVAPSSRALTMLERVSESLDRLASTVVRRGEEQLSLRPARVSRVLPCEGVLDGRDQAGREALVDEAHVEHNLGYHGFGFLEVGQRRQRLEDRLALTVVAPARRRSRHPRPGARALARPLCTGL